MDKQSINKLKLFLTGLEGRFMENSSIFTGIEVIFTTGLKSFKGIGNFKNGSISYNYLGSIKLLTIDNLFQNILLECEMYDSITLTYKDRTESVTIIGDKKNVKMITNKEKNLTLEADKVPETSTLLSRNYYIKIGKADTLLKEIGIMSFDGKIKNDKIRKYNQIDHYVELIDDLLNKLPTNKTINILDCGCGKSYLSFVLNYYLTEEKKRKCHFIGIDRSETVITTAKKMASNLDYRNMEFLAIDINDYKPKGQINLVISLHACDTATDMALALGIKLSSELIIAVPCCQKELLGQYSYAPFKSILKHGIFKTRLADVLTDGLRCLLLEAYGYEVTPIEYISPLETPKNLMIRAIKTGSENSTALSEYYELMSSLNVYPALYAYLQNQSDL